jgi:putative ABC transport system ATP-binding protein
MNMIKSSSKKTKTPILELKNVVKTYTLGGVKFNALDGVCCKIFEGEFVAITGASGSGKSTLMHIIGLLDIPTSGEILLDGRKSANFSENQLAQIRNQTLGFVFQQFNLLPKTPAIENVILPLLYSDIPNSLHYKIGPEMLQKVELSDKIQNTPAQLSGGQQQRVAIARALVNNPKIILADEPTGNLDSKSGREIMDLFKHLNRKEGRTIVFVTHDLSLAKQAQRIIHIKDGQIC